MSCQILESLIVLVGAVAIAPDSAETAQETIQWDHNSGFRPYEDRVRVPIEDWMIKDPSVQRGE